MLLAGIIESDNKTTNLICNMLSSTNKKVGVSDFRKLSEFDPVIIRDYFTRLSDEGTDILLIRISNDIGKFVKKDIQFDIIVYEDKGSQSGNTEESSFEKAAAEIFSLLDRNGIIIMNVDNIELLKLLKGMKFNTITYGFNSKASMTTSSTGDGMFKDNFICCLQRTLPTRDGMNVEPQEYKIKLSSNEYDAYSILAAATFAVVNDIDPNQIQ